MSNSTMTIQQLTEAMREAKRITARHDMQTAQFNLDAFSNRCRVCNYRYRVEGGDMHLCHHQWEALEELAQKRPRIASQILPLSTSFEGYRVCIAELQTPEEK